jgi:hypothetical protein
VSAIQVKNVPENLHERLRERARSQGRNLSEYVLDVLRRDLAVPTTQEWLERLKREQPVTQITSEEIVQAIHEGRAERDAQIWRAISHRD